MLSCGIDFKRTMRRKIKPLNSKATKMKNLSTYSEASALPNILEGSSTKLSTIGLPWDEAGASAEESSSDSVSIL